MTDELQDLRQRQAEKQAWEREKTGSTDGDGIEANGDSLGFEAADGSDEETEKLAGSVLTPAEASVVEDSPMSATKLVAREYGVDPSNYSTESELLRAIARADDEPARSDDSSDGIEAGDWSNSPAPEVEERADSVLTPIEAKEVEDNGETATNYVRRKYGVNAAAYPHESLLLDAISDS